MSNLKLCYIEGRIAWFTTAPLNEQWGDDWDDAPYEHNAGRPYEYMEHMKKRGQEPYVLLWGMWTGDFDEPCAHMFNSPWSVQDINRGEVPWLATDPILPREPDVKIYAGVSPDEFIEKIREGGGDLWIPLASSEETVFWLQRWEKAK